MLSVLFVIYYLIRYNHRTTETSDSEHENQEDTSTNSNVSKSLSFQDAAPRQLFTKTFLTLRKHSLFDKMSAATLPELSECLPPYGEGDGDESPLPVNPIIRRRSSSKTHTRHYRIRLPPNPRRAKRWVMFQLPWDKFFFFCILIMSIYLSGYLHRYTSCWKTSLSQNYLQLLREILLIGT